jgi:hypothetical protein
MPGGLRGWARRHDRLVAACACAAVAVAALARVWASPGTTYPGYAGDPQQSMWFLRWTPYALSHGMNPLTTAHVGYPAGANLMWNTAMVLLGLLLWPITVSAGPVVAYDVAVALALAGSGLAAYVALRRWVGHAGGALAAALLYELSPYTGAHVLGQLNLTVAVTPPLLLLLLDELVLQRRRPAWKPGVLLGLLATAQLMTSEEMLASEAVATAVLLGALLLASRDRRAELRARLKRLGAGLAAALTVALPLMLVPLLVQFGGAQRIHGPLQRPGDFVSDVLNLVIPSGAQLVAPAAAADFAQRFSGNLVEWSAYLGLPLLALLTITARRHWGSTTVRTAVLAGAALFILSLGPSLRVAGVDTHVPLPWAIGQRLPLVGDLLPARLTLYVDLAAALLFGLAVRDALGAAGGPGRPLLAGLCGVTAIAAVPLPASTVATPAFFASPAAQRLPADGSVLVVPYATSFLESQVMLWQAQAGVAFRMPEGYVMMPAADGTAHLGPPPTALSAALQAIASGGVWSSSPASLRAMHADLVRWDVRAVVLGPMPRGERAARQLLSSLLGCSPQAVAGVEVWWSVRQGTCAPAAAG